MLVDSFDCLSRYCKREVFFELRNIHSLFLEVWIFADLASRVIFGSTNNVRVSTRYERALFCYVANLCHMWRYTNIQYTRMQFWISGHAIISPMDIVDSVFYIVVLIMSVVVHEFAHGYVAYRYGDQTAYRAGRLTLNPLKHLDLFGSILLPFILIVTKAGFVLGWARPVPYNPFNFKNEKQGTIAVALAGICANIIVAIVFAVLIRLAPYVGLPPLSLAVETLHPFYHIATTIVLLNIVLAVFNLLPIPPLDGSRLLFSLLPDRFRGVQAFLEQYSFFILLVFVMFLWSIFSPIMFKLFSLFVGV